MDGKGKGPAEVWATAARLVMTLGPFVLLLALFALHRWLSG